MDSGTSVSVRRTMGAKTFPNKHLHTKARHLDIVFVIIIRRKWTQCKPNPQSAFHAMSGAVVTRSRFSGKIVGSKGVAAPFEG